ncbi:MAG TPA: hypothetical protein VGS21_01915, partial [Acidimicrobiales bacterium]|nr:hypothetical protein [Acidimicrobiales bacterium]
IIMMERLSGGFELTIGAAGEVGSSVAIFRAAAHFLADLLCDDQLKRRDDTVIWQLWSEARVRPAEG